MQNTVILTADVHMKSRLWTNYAAIQGDAEAALKTLSGMVNPSSTVLVSCGDLFDSNKPTSVDVGVVKANLEGFQKVLFVSGNHDSCVPPFVELTLGNAYHLNPREPYVVDSLAFFGVDYQASKAALIESLLEVQQAITNMKDKQCVLILHQAMKEFLSFEGSYMLDRTELFGIIPDTTWVFVGDIHVAQEFGTPGSSYLCSPGPLVPQDIGQARQQQRVLSIDPVGLSITSLPLSVRDYHFFDFTEDQKVDIESSLVCIQTDKLLKPVVVVIVHSVLDLAKSLLKSDRYITVVKTKKSVGEAKESSDSPQQVISIEDAIDQEIDETEQSQAAMLKPLIKKLLLSETPDKILTELMKKWSVVSA